MDFVKSVLGLLSNKISDANKQDILTKMDVEAKENLAFAGYLLYYYSQVEHDHEKHVELENLFKDKDIKSMAKNDGNLAFIVGLFYGSAIIFDENISEMEKWFNHATDLGNPLGSFELGFYHYQIAFEGEDNMQKSEIEKAKNYFQKSRELGVIEASLALAELYIEIDDEKMARKMFQEAIEKEDSDGYLGIALIEYDGKNFEKAKEYLLKSFEMDKNRSAAFYLAGIFFDEGDNEKGLYYINESAEQGNVDAIFDLGVLYLEGEIVEQDDQNAFDCFSYAAQRGDAGAQFYLGVFYKEGRVVEQSDEEAKYWFEAAAEQGDEEAIEVLSTMS